MLMLSKLVPLAFATLSLSGALSFLLSAIALSGGKSAWTFTWLIFSSSFLSVELPLCLDLFSALFLFTVLVISTAVLIFSQSYMSNEKFFLRFHLLVAAFVLSMILLILSPNLVSLLLGWDGLGVTSYLLVIYFQSSKSFNAGLLTALTNRVGDVLILLSLALTFSLGGWNFGSWSVDPSWMFPNSALAILMVAACTKSAQIPFSAWLPAAMAAPTPVSSLVHSSTLVTAGVFLLIRFSELFALSVYTSILLKLGAFTMIMAGLSALWELDMKKIVALSTLSQLGLMMVSLGMGCYELAFFHLLAHAFFKALLFMSVGNMIHLSADYQDLRKISLSESLFPMSLAFSVIANLSLCGFPFMAGFYSKDLIVEVSALLSSNLESLLLLLLAIGLTLAYSLRFSYLVMLKSRSFSKLISANDNDSLMTLSMATLWGLAIFGGSLISWLKLSGLYSIELPWEIKNSVLAILILVLSLLPLFSFFYWNLSFSLLPWSWGSMWSLPFISSSWVVGYKLLFSGLSRKLDLSWTPSLSLSPVSGAGSTLSLEKNNFFYNLSYILAFSASLMFIIFLLYLCMLK